MNDTCDTFFLFRAINHGFKKSLHKVQMSSSMAIYQCWKIKDFSLSSVNFKTQFFVRLI